MAKGIENIVYRLLDHDGALLYAGVSSRGLARLQEHLKDKDWAREIASVRIEQFDDGELAALREREIITSEAPRYNVVLNPTARTTVVIPRSAPTEIEQPPSPPVLEEWWTVAEVADKIKVSPFTIRKWIRDGHVRGSQIGGRKLGWRIPISEVERILRGGIYS